MGKKKEKTIEIFCSASLSRIEEIKNVLIPSLRNQSINQRLHLNIINYKADGAIKDEMFNNQGNIEITILNPKKALGFGEAHNFAFGEVMPSNYFLIINPDIYLHKNAIEELLSDFNNDVGIVEVRQLPFSHPKDIPHKKTFETNWASGCCSLINSHFFKLVGGFDANYWMYLEDVDLSWRALINGFNVLQNPNAVAYHFTGVYFKYGPNNYSLEDFYSLRNFLYISFVYWGEKGLKNAQKMIEKLEHYNREIKDWADRDFQNMLSTKNIQHISVPWNLKERVKIFGYNKFSEYPK